MDDIKSPMTEYEARIIAAFEATKAEYPEFLVRRRDDLSDGSICFSIDDEASRCGVDFAICLSDSDDLIASIISQGISSMKRAIEKKRKA